MSSKRKLSDINHSSEIPLSSSKKSKIEEFSSTSTTMGTKAPVRKDSTSSSQPQPKKLVIKTLANKPKLPENFEHETWLKLQKAVSAIQSNQSVEYSLEELFQAVQNLCLHKFSSNLYNNLSKQCELHIKSLKNKLIDQTSDPFQYLILVNNCWQEHSQHMTLIGSIFLYLDRTYVIQTSNVKSIWEMGLELFRNHVIKIPEIERKTVSDILILIEHERKGETIDRSLLKHLLMMFTSLQIYSESFEKEFILATRTFYASEGITYMRETEVADYLKHVENRIREEGERVLHYLDSSTRKLLIPILEHQLLEVHVDTILEKGLANLVLTNRKEDLKRMYTLFNRIHALEKMKVSWHNYIKQTGITLVNDVEKEKTLVQDLMDLRAKLDIILEESFSRNELFSTALKDAFEVFINVRANKPAELIAKFVDSKLRSGNKGVSEEELEQILDKVMILFRYIHGKDVFEAFYKKDLAKRLLLGKSGSIDAEKSMISKLKNECGASFTNKLEGMFKDIEISKDTMNSFATSPFRKKLGNIDLHVHVLTQGYWPPYIPIEINLPKELSDYLEAFKEFYLTKHNGRRLMWHHSLGHCILIATFPHGRKELAVSLFQTVVLLLFNNFDKLSFSEIEKSTGLESNELKRVLQSLSLGKVKILNKSSKIQQILEDDIFSVNTDFKQKLFRIKINSIQLAETAEEQKKTTESVMQDRQYQIDAAIVRIMKTRKQLSHPLLVSELYNQLKFPVKPADLKKRIESLIDREYLERDENDAQIYRYLA